MAATDFVGDRYCSNKMLSFRAANFKISMAGGKFVDKRSVTVS